MIRKLSDIYQSDKEYLKVCNVRHMCSMDKECTVLCSFCIFKLIVCLHIVGKGLAAASSAEGGRGCGQERATAAMATDGPTPLRQP